MEYKNEENTMTMTIDDVLKKQTIKAIELKKGDICIVKNKIYKITAIWFTPEMTKNGLHHKFRFVLYCEDDKSKIEIIYPADFQLELDANSYVEMKTK
jgi:translation elongation factor P/translation initiation factor 5A